MSVQTVTQKSGKYAANVVYAPLQRFSENSHNLNVINITDVAFWQMNTKRTPKYPYVTKSRLHNCKYGVASFITGTRFVKVCELSQNEPLVFNKWNNYVVSPKVVVIPL